MDEAEINRRAAEAADLFVEGPMKQVAIAVATFVLNKLPQMDEAEISRRAQWVADRCASPEGKATAEWAATTALQRLNRPIEVAEPVDPDLIEAREIVAKGQANGEVQGATLLGENDGSIAVRFCLAGLKRGRELEQEEEYGGRPPRSDISENLRAYLERNAAPPIPPADGPTVRFKRPGPFGIVQEVEAASHRLHEMAQRMNRRQRNIEGQP